MALAVALLYGGYQWFGLAGPAIRLTIDPPTDLDRSFVLSVLDSVFPRRGPYEIAQPEGSTVELPLRLTIRNRGGETVAMIEADPCKVVQWYVEEAPGVSIASKGDRCPNPVDSAAALESGGEISTVEPVSFPTPSFDEGRIYRIHVRYFGQDGFLDVRFVR